MPRCAAGWRSSTIGGAFAAFEGALAKHSPNTFGLIGAFVMGRPIVLAVVGAALASLLNPA